MSFNIGSLSSESTIRQVVSQTSTTLIINVQAGDGLNFTINDITVIYPFNTSPLLGMIGKVTGISGDQVIIDITPLNRLGSDFVFAQIGYQVALAITPSSARSIIAGGAGPTTLSGLLSFTGTDHAGVELNSLTTQQRDALIPANGMLLYNSTLARFQRYEDNNWKDFASNGYVTVGASDADYITDGVADNVQIQAAINASNRVLIKSGSYTIASTVTIPSNRILEGEGPGTIITAVNSFSNAVNMFENSDTANGNSNILVQKLKLDGNFANRTQTFSDEAGSNIMFKKTTNSVIRNIISTGAITANIHFAQGTQNCLIKDNIAYNSYDHCILLVGTAGGVEVKQNIIEGNICYGAGQSPATQGVGIELAKYATENIVIGNVSRNNLEGGIHMFYRSNRNLITGNQTILNGQNGIVIVDESDYNSIIGNYIKTSQAYGITATTAFLTYGGYYSNIIGNTIIDCQYSGLSGTMIGAKIEGNFINNCGAGGTGNQRYGVNIVSPNSMQFINNRIISSADRGVEIDSMTRCTIANNFVQSSGSHGMFFDGTGLTDNQITGNIVDTNAGAGLIFLKNAGRCVISNNICKSNSGGNAGIDLRGVTYSTIIGNSCVANAYGIRLQNDSNSVACTYNVISSNTCRLNTTSGLNEGGGADHNIYIGNNCNGNTASNFVTVGINDDIGHNITT